MLEDLAFCTLTHCQEMIHLDLFGNYNPGQWLLGEANRS